MIDTFVTQAKPSANRAGTPLLRLSGAVGDRKRAYMFFAPQVSAGDFVFDAPLLVTLAGAWTGQSLEIRRVTEKWSKQRLTWNTEPATSVGDAIMIPITGVDGDVVELDVTPHLETVAAGAEWLGIRLSIESAAERLLYSSDCPQARKRPSIVVDWTNLPEPITEMSPAGGQAVSSENPELAWQPPGEAEDRESQIASHVQVSTSEDFTAPEYDSGEQANVQTSWTGYSGAVAGEPRFWRARYKNAAGLWSAWSDIQEFVHVPKPVLVITSPGPVTEDATPPFAWDFDGQEWWQYELYELTVDGPREIWRTPRAIGEEQEYTPPAGVNVFGRRKLTYRPLIRSGPTFKATIRVGDDVDRASTASDPPYVEASIEFVYERDGSPDPVTELTATVVDTDPRVRLQLTRDQRPDYFCLVVDGVEVDTRIEPEEISIGGDDYEIVFSGAIDDVEHLYEVEAVVLDNGEYLHSEDNATAVATTHVTGIWLIDEETDTAVRITGPDSALELRIFMSGATFDIPGRRDPVRVTETVGGYRGSFGGHVRTKAENQTFLDMLGDLGVLRFVARDYNFPCRLEENDRNQPHEVLSGFYAVGAGLFQVDEYTFDVAGEGDGKRETESIDSEGVFL